MKKIFVVLVTFMLNVGHAQLIDSFSDGDYTTSPVWSGDTGSWEIVANSTASSGATSSNTLHLNHAVNETGTQYLSTQIASMSSSNGHSWSFWIGRRSQAFTAANRILIWLYANEGDLESTTVDGYAVLIGDDSGNDEIILSQMTNGASSGTIVTSSGSLTNGLTDIGFMVRITRSNSGDWNLFTSTLPTANGAGAVASDLPSSSNVTVSQGSGNNSNVTINDNGYIGIVAVHSSGSNGRTTVEFDQIYFDTDVNSALPVELTSFTAIVNKSSVTLNWQTATEKDNYGFEIQRAAYSGQRSANANRTLNTDNWTLNADNWTLLGFVNGHGNSNSPKEYSFVDNEVLESGKYLYRLKQIDTDGSYEYSNAVEVDFGTPAAFELMQNYPNPFNPSAIIKYAVGSGIKQLVTLKVFDILGNEIEKLVNEEKEPGIYEVEFSAKDGLTSGIYYYQLQAGDFIAAKKMLLLK